MDIEDYSLEELLLAAIKSEIEAEKVYMELANRVKNPFLKGRLEFLSKEEARHRAFLEAIYKKTFPDSDMRIPEKTPVPLPEIQLYGESGDMRDVIMVLEDGMRAEKAAHEFYSSLKERFNDEKIRKTLHYLSIMELDHYEILKKERDELAEVEDIMEDGSFVNLDGMY